MKLAHVTIKVKDMEESLKFYKDIVGLPIIMELDSIPGKKIVFLGKGESKIELIQDDSIKEINIGKEIAIGFGVEDLDQAWDFVISQGLEIFSGPFQPDPNTRFFYILDPSGLKVQLVESK